VKYIIAAIVGWAFIMLVATNQLVPTVQAIADTLSSCAPQPQSPPGNGH
jgi:hypothetical protein